MWVSLPCCSGTLSVWGRLEVDVVQPFWAEVFVPWKKTHQLIARLWVEVIFQRESWLARSHVHTKVLQFQPEFHLWLSGLSCDYSVVVFSSATCHHRWSCSNFITVQLLFRPKRASSGTGIHTVCIQWATYIGINSVWHHSIKYALDCVAVLCSRTLTVWVRLEVDVDQPFWA